MKIIKEFAKFRADYKPINIYIKGKDPIVLNYEMSRKKEILIRSIINEIYPNLTGDGSFDVDGFTVSGELLNKSQKNIAILYEIVDIAESINVTISTANDLIEFISKYRFDLFSVGGRFFDRIYARLGGVTEKGKKKELESNDLFIRYTNSKGIKIDLKSPKSYKEDIAGIDAYFEYNDNIYTIQTKTLSSISESGDNYIVYISGYFTKIKTHYLVLIPKDIKDIKDVEDIDVKKVKKVKKLCKYIFKGKNVKTLIDKQGVNYYLIPKLDLLYKEE